MKFIYTGIRVRDLKRSLEFYTKTMGMKETSRGKMEARTELCLTLTFGYPYPPRFFKALT